MAIEACRADGQRRKEEQRSPGHMEPHIRPPEARHKRLLSEHAGGLLVRGRLHEPFLLRTAPRNAAWHAYKHDGRARAVMTFVPFAGLERRLHPAGPLRVPGAVGDFSMDGRSVIFVMRDRTGSCDRIGLWSKYWTSA